MLLVELPMLLDEDLIEGQALPADLAPAGRLDDRASRLSQMRAIVELAPPQERPELAHRLSDLVFRQVEEAEGLEARRIDDGRVLVQPVEAREGRGLRARFARRGELAHARDVAQHERVDGARLAHSALADE